MVYLFLTGEVIKTEISKNRNNNTNLVQIREVIENEYDVIFMCEIDIFVIIRVVI